MALGTHAGHGSARINQSHCCGIEGYVIVSQLTCRATDSRVSAELSFRHCFIDDFADYASAASAASHSCR